MSDHTHTTIIAGCYRCELSTDEVAAAHREQLAEYEALGRPPLCDRCGGYYDAEGEWDTLPTCAESPLPHDELCTAKKYRGDVCPTCATELGWPLSSSHPVSGEQG